MISKTAKSTQLFFDRLSHNVEIVLSGATFELNNYINDKKQNSTDITMTVLDELL